MDPSPDSQFVNNPHLKLLDDDMLFHIGIKAGDHQKLRNLFGDVKVSFLVTTSFSKLHTNSAQVTVSCFAAINHASEPRRAHKFTHCTSGAHLRVVIGRFDPYCLVFLVVINMVNGSQK